MTAPLRPPQPSAFDALKRLARTAWQALAPRLREPYVLPLLGAGSVALVFAGFAWRRRPARGAVELALFNLGVAEWSLCYAAELSSPMPQQRVFWARMQYFGITTVPTSGMLLLLKHLDRTRWLTWRTLPLFCVEPLLTLLLIWSNDRHRLIWTSWRIEQIGRRPRLMLGRGPLFWVHTFYSYALVLIGSARMINALVRSPQIYRGQRAILLIGALAPLVGNMLYVLPISPFPDLDVTPFAFAITSVALALGLFRFRLLDVIPVARDAVFESLSDAVIVLDVYDRVIDLNPAAQKLFNRPPSALIGQPLEWVSTIDPALLRRYRNAPDGHEELSFGEGELRRTFDLRISTLYDRRRQRTGRLMVLRDISERKRAEEARLELERQLLESQKLESLGVMAGGIAHDFNNLLQVMLGNVSLARLALEDKPEQLPALARIETAARRAADLTGQMLAYAGRGKIQNWHVNLNVLVEEISDLLHVSIPKTAVLQYQLAAELPMIVGDTTQLRQVVMNLVLNAAEALEDRSGTITLRTSARWVDAAYLMQTHRVLNVPEGEYVLLEVIDTGSGMDAQTLEHIFEPFFTTKFAGRGLGLAAVLGIVRGHHGTLRVESTLGRGTAFTVLFPCAETRDRALVEQSAPAELRDRTIRVTDGLTGPVSAQRNLVLVVDDEPGVLEVAQQILDYFGFAVISAVDGMQALEIFRMHAGQIACVLLDATMPQLRGEAVAQALWKIDAKVRVVLMSGYHEPAHLRHQHNGVSYVGFLQKPFSAQELGDMLFRALSGLE